MGHHFVKCVVLYNKNEGLKIPPSCHPGLPSQEAFLGTGMGHGVSSMTPAHKNKLPAIVRRYPQKLCQELLLRPTLHTRQGPG